MSLAGENGTGRRIVLGSLVRPSPTRFLPGTGPGSRMRGSGVGGTVGDRPLLTQCFPLFCPGTGPASRMRGSGSGSSVRECLSLGISSW